MMLTNSVSLLDRWQKLPVVCKACILSSSSNLIKRQTNYLWDSPSDVATLAQPMSSISVATHTISALLGTFSLESEAYWNGCYIHLSLPTCIFTWLSVWWICTSSNACIGPVIGLHCIIPCSYWAGGLGWQLWEHEEQGGWVLGVQGQWGLVRLLLPLQVPPAQEVHQTVGCHGEPFLSCMLM